MNSTRSAVVPKPAPTRDLKPAAGPLSDAMRSITEPRRASSEDTVRHHFATWISRIVHAILDSGDDVPIPAEGQSFLVLYGASLWNDSPLQRPDPPSTSVRRRDGGTHTDIEFQSVLGPEEVIVMIPPLHPEHTLMDQHELSVRAAEKYELKRALREAKQQRSAERGTTGNRGRYLGLVLRRSTTATPQ